MISGISAVAVRLIQVTEDGQTHIVTQSKGPVQTAFYQNCFFKVETGECPGRLFYLCDTGEEIWGNTPEEALASVNDYVRHH